LTGVYWSGNLGSMSKIWSSLIRLFFAVALLECGARGDVMNLSPVADTGLLQGNPTNNMGGHTNFIGGVLANGFATRGLIEFNPSASIPTNSIINSVTLTLTITASAPSPATFELHPLLVSWGEGNKTGQTGAPATAGEATWNARFTSGSLWSAPGGAAGVDYSAASSASTAVGPTSLLFNSTPGLVTDVQNWLENPAADFGWILIDQSEATAGTARRFASREDALGRGPVLTIDFTPAPEPSTLALLGIGATGLLFRFLSQRAELPSGGRRGTVK
jgi:hypothetical protein